MFNWTDDIHFVAIQLNHYLGKDGWSYRLCSDFVGCSASSVSKYLRQEWECSPEKAALINKAIFELEYKNCEIKLLTPQKERYFLDAQHSRAIKKPFEKDTPIEAKRIYKELQTKYPQTGKVEFVWPDKGGVYLLAQIVSPPTRPAERYYIIKVGKSTNLHKRISAYKGMNPFAVCIDVKQVPPRDIDATEIKYHMLLNKRYLRQGNTEWFVVPEQDYEKILKKGFDAL